jgi:TM2 domain-containing membrane protein YozV
MPNFCPTCGAELKYPDAEICPSCGVRIKEPAMPKYIPEPIEEKSAGIAALCSFFIPGLGQVYNGNLEKGVIVLIGTLIGAIFLLIPGIVVWIYGIYDAYTTAEKMIKGVIPVKSTKLSHIIIFFILGLFILVVAFVLFLMFLAFVIAVIGIAAPPATHMSHPAGGFF